MALIDSHRNSLSRKQSDLTKLLTDKAKEQKKISDTTIKINRASEAINRTKSTSTIQSKLREITRYEKDLANSYKKIADIETKIGKKNKEIQDAQTKVDKELASIDKKRKAEADKLRREQEQNLRNIGSTLQHHNNLHTETRYQIEELKNIPEKIVVLFLASNPIDQQQLRLDEEARAISEMIRKSKHRDSVKFETCWAFQPIDLLQAINEYKPSIIHFSGHGSDNDEIIFQTNDGRTKIVSKEAIVQTIMASSDGIRLVFFNTCYSKNQAEAVSEYVEATIGMNTSIGDEAARIFSSQFYSSIGFGLSVKKSFEQAKALLMLENISEEETPELFIKEGINSEDLIIVKPKK
ncbi:CHAT domain-containing protein [Winogradskyella thalassocola]|uniref:CHAT domain-containing protein n=1 Tax=Winogradskyella thalassocola TaxID=262004 RepID=A0A1G8M8B9_9FLAO|nr:CHAT domain-containing protein [Winogradskyella thalassocola]SDI64184.1 CHAT domain-containing protein [Winogradskyella thalassocola]